MLLSKAMLLMFGGCLSTTTAAAIGSPDYSLLQQLSNSSLLNLTVEPLDPRFHIGIAYGREDLDRTSCLMNTVDALATLAGLDFLSRQGDFHGHMTQYPKAYIDITPVWPATDVENRIAVWGLFFGMKDMITTNTWKDTSIELNWENVVVAEIIIGPSETSSSALKATLNSTTSLLNTSTAQNSISGTDSLAVPRVSIDFHFLVGGQPLEDIEVYYIVMAALKNLAEWPSTDPVDPYVQRCTDYNVEMTFPAGASPHARGYFYQYRWIIESVRRIPAWMLGEGRWAELGLGIFLDDAWLADAYLTRPPYPRLAKVALQGANITVS